MRALLVIGLVAGLASQAVHANCVAPTPLTTVPKGATASREAMLSAMQSMKAYSSAFAAYAECMQKTAGDLAQLEFEEVKLQKIADKFNAEMRTFKAR